MTKGVHVSGWLNRDPMEGSEARILHVVRNNGTRVCRCAYSMGIDTTGKRVSTFEVDSAALTQDGDRQLRLSQAGVLMNPVVVLCDKSHSVLSQEIKRMSKWNSHSDS